jgi:phosphoribosyl 1,2-cyclic phosphodiesterase
MREQCIRLLPRHGIRTLDALLLTHAHADAIHGLDDIRDFQQQGARHLDWLPPLPVYTNANTFDEIKRRFSYLVPGAGSDLEKEAKAAGGANSTTRTVSKLEWHTIQEGERKKNPDECERPYQPFDVKGCEGLQVTALPVRVLPCRDMPVPCYE